MALAEAERCMDCKKPFCVDGCPVNINIPKFIEKIREEKFGEALDIIREDSMLPAICGRVCPQENQCEGKCIRGKKGDPVAIGQLERFLGDQPELASQAQDGPQERQEGRRRGLRPVGITCAGELARNGFDVHCLRGLLHRRRRARLRHPRVPSAQGRRQAQRSTAWRRWASSLSTTRSSAASPTPRSSSPRGYDAIYIATARALPKFLNVPGENLPNVFFANEYLTRVNLMKANRFPEYDTPTKHGKNVVVFGGGNVAMDAVRTAKRLGAERAIIAYRRTEDECPPVARSCTTPRPRASRSCRSWRRWSS